MLDQEVGVGGATGHLLFPKRFAKRNCVIAREFIVSSACISQSLQSSATSELTE